MSKVYSKCLLFKKKSIKHKNAGFTLIELLIVVLIIGVLAAVALPKYQVAVMRSKYTQLIALAEAYKKAEERYVMANGKYSFDFSNLDVVPPAGWEIRNSGKEIASSSGVYCTLQDGSGNALIPTIYCSMDLLMYYPKYSSSERLCGVKNGNTLAKKVCLSMGGVYANSVSGGNVDYYVLP